MNRLRNMFPPEGVETPDASLVCSDELDNSSIL